jgi:hypothetical protein
MLYVVFEHDAATEAKFRSTLERLARRLAA